MKTKLAISILIGLLALAFIFNNTTNLNNTAIRTAPPPTNNTSDFLIGSLNTGAVNNFNYIIDTLGYNFWHWYVGAEIIGGKHYPTGWTEHDKLFATDNQYVTEVENFISNIHSHNNIKVLLHRPKIEWLCYGQRSDYRCVDVSHVDADY